MALGGVFMTDTDGNIGTEKVNLTEKVCGLLFDISAQSNFWTVGVGATLAAKLQNTVVELNCLEDAEDLGIMPYTGETTTVESESVSSDFLYGIPYYHIKQFFQKNSNSGRLFIAFANCSSNWNALIDMQKAAHGVINQFGVWTEQSLWRLASENAEQYTIQLRDSLELVAESLANDYNAPCVILLNANTAKVLTSNSSVTSVVWSKIPTCISHARYVSVLLGQDSNDEIAAMQTSLDSCTPVGNIGIALGCLAASNVAESIGWVQQHDLADYFTDIELGFGNATVVNHALTNPTRYDSLTQVQIDHLDDLGYVFLCRYAGLEGHVYFTGDQTCSDGDYRTISRNRVINKSRRSVRTALLPYVNSPIKVDPSTGRLSTAQITVFSNLITDILNAMRDAEEISGIGQVTIPADQNILKNDRLIIQYTMVPIGTAKEIKVTEGLVLSA